MTPPAKELAAAFVTAVHDNDTESCHRILLEASRDDLYALAVVLAASVRLDDPLMAHWKPNLVPVSEIVYVTCMVTGCDLADFNGDRKFPEYVRARQIAAWVGAMAGYTYAELGRQMKRDHTTVMNSVDRVTRDPELHRYAVQVVEKLGADRVQAAAQQQQGVSA